jgi:hypothetical protein
MSNQKPRIQIHIDNKGDTRIVDITGAGKSCQELTGDLEKTLGLVDEKSRETTSAAYEKHDQIRLSTES